MSYNYDYTKVTPLCEIMVKERSDKGSLDPINCKHNYTTFYHAIFKDLQYKPLRVFELGLGTNNIYLPSNMGANGRPGASLYGWKEYFTNSMIFGADIDKNILFNEDRIVTFYCDQTNPQVIREMWSEKSLQAPFDIIVEDGLHTFSANVCFFENSIHKLKQGGYYIIEDIVEYEIGLFTKKMDEWRLKYTDMTFELIKIPSTSNTIDNNLIVVHRRDPVEELNKKYNTEFTNTLYTNMHIFYEIYEACGCKFWRGCGSYMFDGQKYEYCDLMYEKQELLFQKAKESRNVLEIGTYMGHSLLIMLIANPNLKITCIDISDEFTRMAVAILNRHFNNAITFIHGDSLVEMQKLTDKFDLFHIDGYHDNEYISKEFKCLFNLTSEPVLRVVFDDQESLVNLQKYISENYEVTCQVTPVCRWNNTYFEIKL